MISFFLFNINQSTNFKISKNITQNVTATQTKEYTTQIANGTCQSDNSDASGIYLYIKTILFIYIQIYIIIW